VYPEKFRYLRASSLEEVTRILESYGSRAKILAGGQSLIPILKLKLAQVELVVDIKQIPELRYVKESNTDGDIIIGPTTTHSEIANSDLLKRKCPILAEAASLVGHPNIRNRGTMGGSLSHSDPAGDYIAPMVALEGKMEVMGRKGRRLIEAIDFFTGPFATSMAEEEMLVAIHIPNSSTNMASTYQKFEFFPGDFALVNAAMVMRIDDGVCRNPRFVTSAGLEKPIRLFGAERELEGKIIDRDSQKQSLDLAVSDFVRCLSGEPPSRQEYYSQLLKVLLKKGFAKMS
jgi:carbon-monoxide dehydrogenase medium subunit